MLGRGGFGKVYAVVKKDTQHLYACKSMDKKRIHEKGREGLILSERNIMYVCVYVCVCCVVQWV
jgi:serine/threonine protein kinase